jgi:hypothetical protein
MVTGALAFPVKSGTSSNGNAWARGAIRCAMGELADVLTIMAFGESAEALMALGKGQVISAHGRIEIGQYATKDGEVRTTVTLLASHLEVLRRPAFKPRREAERPVDAYALMAGKGEDEFDDRLAF